MYCSEFEEEGVKLGSSPNSVRKTGFLERVKNILSPSKEARQLEQINYESTSTVPVDNSTSRFDAFKSSGLPRTPPSNSKATDEKEKDRSHFRYSFRKNPAPSFKTRERIFSFNVSRVAKRKSKSASNFRLVGNPNPIVGVDPEGDRLEDCEPVGAEGNVDPNEVTVNKTSVSAKPTLYPDLSKILDDNKEAKSSATESESETENTENQGRAREGEESSPLPPEAIAYGEAFIREYQIQDDPTRLYLPQADEYIYLTKGKLPPKLLKAIYKEKARDSRLGLFFHSFDGTNQNFPLGVRPKQTSKPTYNTSEMASEGFTGGAGFYAAYTKGWDDVAADDSQIKGTDGGTENIGLRTERGNSAGYIKTEIKTQTKASSEGERKTNLNRVVPETDREGRNPTGREIQTGTGGGNSFDLSMLTRVFGNSQQQQAIFLLQSLQPFSGKSSLLGGKSPRFESWIRGFESVLDMADWDDQTKIKLLSPKLTEYAADALDDFKRSYPRESKIYSEVKKHLMNRFHGSETRNTHLNDYKECVKQPSESIMDYACRLKKKFYLAYPLTEAQRTNPDVLVHHESVLKDKFIDGLPFELRLKLKRKTFSSYDTLIKAAVSYEDIYEEERRAKKEIEIISNISSREDQHSDKLPEAIEQLAARIESISKISVDAIADMKKEMRGHFQRKPNFQRNPNPTEKNQPPRRQVSFHDDFYQQGTRRRSVEFCDYCGIQGHVQSVCRKLRFDNNTCITCGKPGHIARDCRPDSSRPSRHRSQGNH